VVDNFSGFLESKHSFFFLDFRAVKRPRSRRALLSTVAILAQGTVSWLATRSPFCLSLLSSFCVRYYIYWYIGVNRIIDVKYIVTVE